MKKGTVLINLERNHQIEKYGFTGEHHAKHPEWYGKGQLVDAAEYLMYEIEDGLNPEFYPENWDKDWFHRLCQKPYKERLVIAGALIAAEIDRLQALERMKKP